MCIAGLDVGTTGVRAVVFTEKGDVISSSYQEYPLIHTEAGIAELDPSKVWKAAEEVLRDVFLRAPKKVKALSISSFGGAVFPISKDGTPLYNAILAFDNRSVAEEREILDTVGEEKFFEITGTQVRWGPLGKILWLRRHKTKEIKDTWKFVGFEDYILFKFGFQPVISYSLASWFGLDRENKEWSEKVLCSVGIRADQLSKPVPAGEVLGKLAPRVAKEVGAPGGMTMVTGAHDIVCALLGAGVWLSTPHLAVDSTGTWETIAIATNEPITTTRAAQSGIASYPIGIDDGYITLATLPTAGSILRWFRDEFESEKVERATAEGKDVYDLLFESVDFSGGHALVLPHFSGSGSPYMDSNSKGAILGLSLGSHREDVFQAIVEGVTHEVSVIKEELESLTGTFIETLRVVGGGSRSRKWCQLKSDIFEKPVETLQVYEASALGAAILAANAIKVYQTIPEAIGGMVKPWKNFYPDPVVSKVYKRQHEVYKRVYRALAEINHALDP